MDALINELTDQPADKNSHWCACHAAALLLIKQNARIIELEAKSGAPVGVKQLIEHDPANGYYGDCERTAIAYLLRKHPSDVPHFGEHFLDSEKFFAAENAYLKDLGLGLFHLAYLGAESIDDLLRAIGSQNPNLHYTLCGQSERNINHVVVCKGSKMIFDPHPDNQFLIRPCDDGFYWVSILTPLVHNSTPVPADKVLVPSWISISDRLPDEGEDVLICIREFDEEDGTQILMTGYYQVGSTPKWFMNNGDSSYEPTHWMPLPDAPMLDAAREGS